MTDMRHNTFWYNLILNSSMSSDKNFMIQIEIKL